MEGVGKKVDICFQKKMFSVFFKSVLSEPLLLVLMRSSFSLKACNIYVMANVVSTILDWEIDTSSCFTEL